MNRRKANVLKPMAKAGSIKQTKSPVAKFDPPFDIVKDEAVNIRVGIRLMHTQGKTMAILPIVYGRLV